jgi:hypothetical protein
MADNTTLRPILPSQHSQNGKLENRFVTYVRIFAFEKSLSKSRNWLQFSAQINRFAARFFLGKFFRKKLP